MNTENSEYNNQQVTSTRRIKIELLALDLDTCKRCVGTLENIETAIKKIKRILEITGTEIDVNKTLIESEEEAEKVVSEVSACCSTEKQETCCEPSEKLACCGAEESGTCGCL